MFTKILERRIRAKTEHLLSNSQFGFRKGRGCTDAIFALRQLCEKTIEYDNERHLIFVDLEKAFDRVDRNKLWKVLECYGIHGQLLDSVRAIYKNSQSAVRTASGLTNWFPVTSGVRQGCVLSPLLFIIYMDRITQAANPDPECLNELLFADDQALFSPDKDTLQEHINQLNRQCEAHGMRINIKKTEAIIISRNETTTAFNIEGNALLNATEFKYLGSFFTKNGRLDREIEVRCQKANSISYQLAPLLKHESIPIATKAKLINSIFLTTLTYQCQTWPLTQGLKNKLVTCEMRCLRKVVNKTRRDKIRNEVIRAQVGATPVLQHVENQQIKWFGHLMRMPTDQPAHRAYNSRYSGKRPKGRPRRRWSDSVADTLEGYNKSLCEASHLAVERRLHLPATPNGTSGRKKVKVK
ncbi:reverse transcriptase-like protein [Elysia marginata]|uniref:Reverse transcriptase-like protein n=1 Tax=Elysia marginata TaxID=1093978 RepID=A0AAV4JBC1_9GAST|nr:reverse transcriptase-like protein [Elysia marginata]